MPIHTHTGAEVTLVLAGGFTDETGSYGPGDISHSVKPAASTSPWLMMMANASFFAVNEGGIWLTGSIGRVLNPVGELSFISK